MNKENIRNFCIIAHIDHGKSTLADRLLEFTQTVREVEMPQMLDSMDIEREKGITVKSHSVRMKYKVDYDEYILNLIDTPGHADFSYEVSRAIASCEGAILLVDATQGIQAQTVSHLRVALEHNLKIIPVINKIDIANARQISLAKEELANLLKIPSEIILEISAKTGEGVKFLLEKIILDIPPPQFLNSLELKALIYDSYYDTYKGVVSFVRVFSGKVIKGKKMMLFSNRIIFTPEVIGILTLDKEEVNEIDEGDVGYIITGIKDPELVRVGDTITYADNPVSVPVKGFKEPKPMVFASFYPSIGETLERLKSALEKLHLSDPSFTFQPESSKALGSGFRCGFLGTLHMEIIQHRLEKEYGVDVFLTTPSVSYEVELKNGKTVKIDSVSALPPLSQITFIREPFVRVNIVTQPKYVSDIIELSKKYRGEYISQEYLGEQTIEINLDMPLAEIIYDFYSNLKSVSHGYASLDYFFLEYRKGDLVKLDILIHGEPVDSLVFLVHRSKAYEIGKAICQKLKEHIPRQLFEVAIQAAIGSRIIARETIPALRKNVTAKCYGGDVTRKRKLLERQKEGKKRLKQIGKVQVPQEAFISVLKINR